jgi:hypothetical protein
MNDDAEIAQLIKSDWQAHDRGSRFEALTAVNIQVEVFWIVTPRKVVKY